jgi:putative Mg2+ transporter-C (MgtC) family protein
MTTDLGWREILLRLTFTAIAGALVGIDRGEHGRPAGLRTTLLVCFAASISMIQTNLLLASAGKRSDSFVSIDVMRLPLGILTGMGFIGGGAILKRGDIIVGVTTAATLWFVTVVGLCYGGGQYLLGSLSLAIGMVVLTSLRRVELRLPQTHRATLTIAVSFDGPTREEVVGKIAGCGYRLTASGVDIDKDAGRWTLRCEVHWRARPSDAEGSTLVEELSGLPGVSRLKWSPQGVPDEPG